MIAGIKRFLLATISSTKAFLSYCILELKDSIDYNLHNKERPHQRLWSIICFIVYGILVGILFLPTLNMTGIFIVISIISLYTIILASILGYLALVSTIVFHSSFLLVVTLYQGSANEYYAFSWQHEVFARQFSDQLHIITVSFTVFVIISAFVISILSEKARKRLQKLEQLSMIDGLTEVYNHRYFHQRLEEEIANAQREHLSLGLLMIDLDNFKGCNDLYGHTEGDRLLKKSASFFKEMVRINDIVCRVGGDEFAIILPNSNEGEVNVIADRIKNAYNLTVGFEEEIFQMITLSIGFSIYPHLSKNKEVLILHADTALYQSKRKGRDKVYCYRNCLEELNDNTPSTEEDTC